MPFDPNKPFEPVEVGFDPNKPFEPVESKPATPDLAERIAGPVPEKLKQYDKFMPKDADVINAIGTAGMGGMIGPATRLGRVALGGVAGGASGAIRTPKPGETRLGNAALGAVEGAAVPAAIEGGTALAQGLAGGVSNLYQRMKDAYRMRSNPAATMSEAQGKMTETAQALRSPDRAILDEKLQHSTIRLEPSKLEGIDPEVDTLLRQHGNQPLEAKSYTDVKPDYVTVPGDVADYIKSKLDSQVNWKSPIYGSEEAAQAAAQKTARIKEGANHIRQNIREQQPEIGAGLQEISQGLRGAKMLEKRATMAPDYLTGKSVSRQANLQKLGEQAGTDLYDYSKSLGISKDMAQHPLQKGLGASARALGQGAKKGVSKGASRLQVFLKPDTED